MPKFKSLIILSMFLGLSLGVKASESNWPDYNVWKVFEELPGVVGKLKFVFALVTLDHRFLPAELEPQAPGSPVSSLTPEGPTSPTFLSSPIVSPEPLIDSPVRSFASLFPGSPGSSVKHVGLRGRSYNFNRSDMLPVIPEKP